MAADSASFGGQVNGYTTLWCWGVNSAGELGLGSTGDQDLPQEVNTPASADWTSVAAADSSHTCALRIHALWCWGDDTAGDAGIGHTSQQNLPHRWRSRPGPGGASLPQAASTQALSAPATRSGAGGGTATASSASAAPQPVPAAAGHRVTRPPANPPAGRLRSSSGRAVLRAPA
jgi:Regulator of chromosome condensation (RCC1) repeat